MRTKTKHTGKTSSIPIGMAIAAAVSMLTTLILSITIAYLLHTEKISWKQSGYWIMCMLFAASFIGGKCAYAAIKRQRLTVSIMAGVLYWGLLLCITALFFGGNFDAVWVTGAIIGAGCGTAALFQVPIEKKHRKKIEIGYR